MSDNQIQTLLDMRHNTLILIFAFLILSCKEELPEPEIIDFRPVKIIWSGPYEIDLCGFSVEIDNQFYKPTNEDFLGSEFKTFNDTTVEMKYKDLKRKVNTSCGWGLPFEANGIEILEIR